MSLRAIRRGELGAKQSVIKSFCHFDPDSSGEKSFTQIVTDF